MNSKQQRKVEQQKRALSFQRTVDDPQMNKMIMDHLKDLLDKERLGITKTVVDAMISIFVVCLHDDYNFGKKRIDSLLLHVQNQFECYEKGLVKLEELDELARNYYTYEKIFKS
jgi:hypothetical protein